MQKSVLDNEIKCHLQYIVAKYFYEDTSISEVKQIVDKLMQDNVWHDNFISIIDADKSNSIHDAISKLTNALRILGITLPENKKQAFWYICHHHISLMANNTKPITNLYNLMAYFSSCEIPEYDEDYDLHDLSEIYIYLDGMLNLEDEVVKQSYIGGKWYTENKHFFDARVTETIAAAKQWLANLEMSMESFLEKLAKVCKKEMIDYDYIKQDDGKLDIEIRSSLEDRYLIIKSLCTGGFNLHFNVENICCFDSNEWDFEYPMTAYRACLAWINDIVTEQQVGVITDVPGDYQRGRYQFGRVTELKEHISQRFKTISWRKNSYYIRSFKRMFDEDIRFDTHV